MLHKGISTRLNYSVRFSGSPIEKDETVAQHIAAMSLMAIELYNVFLQNNLDFNIDKVCKKIVLHDLDEAPLGDIPRPVKYYNEDVHRELDKVADEELVKNYHQKIVDEVRNAKDDTFEGLIVNLLDSLQCVYRLRVSYTYSKRFKGMLNHSIDVARSKIDAIDPSTPELKLLKKVCWDELLDEMV